MVVLAHVLMVCTQRIQLLYYINIHSFSLFWYIGYSVGGMSMVVALSTYLARIQQACSQYIQVIFL